MGSWLLRSGKSILEALELRLLFLVALLRSFKRTFKLVEVRLHLLNGTIERLAVHLQSLEAQLQEQKSAPKDF